MSWTWAGDAALIRTFDQPDLARANAFARALGDRLRGRDDVDEVVLGARTVLVAIRPGSSPGEDLLRAIDADPGEPAASAARAHEIAVEYDGEDVDGFAGLSRDDVVRLHAGATYTVAFLGFSPGFAYLIGLPDELRAPRLATPRARVPAGSVAIADVYTAVYPSSTPGGWRLIGRTDEPMFDPRADPPARLRPGDTVRFVTR